MNEIRQKAKEIYPTLVDFRRDLHRHPEPSMEEVRTTEKIAAELDKAGIPYRRLDPTGLIGEIKGGKPGKTIALRGDIDALSIQEVTGLPYESENPGMMHACGHDGHTTSLLGASLILNGMKEELSGTVRLIFQPAEEIAEGAKLVIAQGGMDGVDAIFGMHNMSQLEAGCIAGSPGGSFAAADIFTVKIIGKACHGALPHTGIDATVVAAAVVMNLQTMVSRQFSPMDPLVVTVGSLHSGSRFNICSGEAVMEGTLRSFSKEVHDALPAVFERIIRETAAAYGAEAEIIYRVMTAVTTNEANITEIARGAAKKIVDAPEKVIPQPVQTGGEDFAFYTELAPAAFFLYGVGGEYPWHSDHYTFEENALEVGMAMYAQTAIDMLEALSR